MQAHGRPFAVLTCYDFPTAQVLQAAGIPVLLVGDSAGTTVLGHDTTRNIAPDFLLTLTEAVRRGAPNVFLMADMPFRSTASLNDAVAMGRRFVEEAGADIVKVECRQADVAMVRGLVQAHVPVCAHLGLLPQRVEESTGFRAQGRTPQEADRITHEAHLMVEAGAQMLLLEAVPDEVSAAVVHSVSVPVIGCGAGPSCHGHVVVINDLLGFNPRPPRFVEVLADAPAFIGKAASDYLQAIASRAYPADKHRYGMKS